nr:glycosyl hydrolase family 18 protein [Evansella caseinilytica]
MKKVFSIFLIFTMLSAIFPVTLAGASSQKFNMTYVYFGNTDTFIRNVDHIGGSLHVAAPSYFDLHPDGSLKLTHQFDTRFIQEMHNRGVKVVPFISNHWDRMLGRAALQNREKLSTQIANAVQQYNLDGVNVDIENVTEVDKDAFTDFVRLLREKIPAAKEVSVAVAANPNGWTKGWHGSYDYAKLAQHADYLMLMAYDESYEWGPVGPVASLPWVERSIQAVLKHAPPEKVVLGVPFFGRYWVEGQTHGGIGLSNHRVEEIVARYQGTVRFDQTAKSPVATFTINASDPKTVVGSRTLAPGNYTLWFENAESLQHKIDLIHKYQLKGMGSWSLGQEQSGIWPELNRFLNGTEAAPTQPEPVENPITEPVIEQPQPNNQSGSKKDTTPPGIKNKKTSYQSKNHQVTLSYHIDEPAAVTTSVRDSSGKLLRTLENKVSKRAGTHTATWNAANVKNGRYTFRIVATDASNNTRTVNHQHQLVKANTKSGKVNASTLNVRAKATTNSRVIGTLKRNATVTIISQQGNWYKINYGKTTGYISSKYVKNVR